MTQKHKVAISPTSPINSQASAVTLDKVLWAETATDCAHQNTATISVYQQDPPALSYDKINAAISKPLYVPAYW
jgi:hypothetical protein